jgi:hypothetical protein
VTLTSARNTPHFHDETMARQQLQAVRWPDGPFCPHCGTAEKAYQLQGKAHRPVEVRRLPHAVYGDGWNAIRALKGAVVQMADGRVSAQFQQEGH